MLEGVPPPSPEAEPDSDALRVHLGRLRHARGWSLDELAARSGIGRCTLATLESGHPRCNPDGAAPGESPATWLRLTRAFEMDLGELLGQLADGDATSRQ